MAAARYFTPEFTDTYLDALRRDALFQRLTKDFRARIQLRCYDTPDGMDVVSEYDIGPGTITYEWKSEKAPSSLRLLPFDKQRLLGRTTAPYRIWVKLDKKEMGVIDAILSPHYTFEGPTLRVLRHLRVFNRMGDIAAGLPKSY